MHLIFTVLSAENVAVIVTTLCPFEKRPRSNV